MACSSVIMCPSNGNYSDIMKDGFNCVMYEPNLSDFYEKLNKILTDEGYRKLISNEGLELVKYHSYSTKIKNLFSKL